MYAPQGLDMSAQLEQAKPRRKWSTTINKVKTI
jgi:hypothetical protein